MPSTPPNAPIALPALRAVRMQGHDVLSYLHTKLATDVRSWSNAVGGPALAVDINGRMVAAGLLLREEVGGKPAWTWILPAPHHERLRTHLERFVIMEDVTLSEENAHRWYLVAGDQLSVVGLSAPPSPQGLTRTEDGYWVTAVGLEPWPTSSVLVGVPIDREAAWVERCTEVLGEPHSADVLRHAQVRAGKASFPEDLHEAETIPIEAGAWSMIGLSKGCYLGQEVIERLYARGRPNKRLMALKWRGEAVSPRHPLVAGGREAGWITGAVETNGETVAMGYVRRRWLDDRTLPLLLQDLDIPVEVGDYIGGEAPPPERR